MHADLIFVLAGHRSRKVFGARLFRDGFAPMVMMSTGDPPFIARVLEKEAAPSVPLQPGIWSHVHDVSLLPPPRGGHFFALLDRSGWHVDRIGVGAFGTLSEMKALGDWLRQHPAIRSLLIVSVGYHLRRIFLCCQALFPRDREVRLISTTDSELPIDDEQETEGRGPGGLVLESIKVLLYRLVLIGTGSGSRQAAATRA
jgi:hypothetical protein